MGRLLSMGASTLLSGGILNNGTLGGYISEATRVAMGMGLAERADGQALYFSKDSEILKRAAIQFGSQLAYGALRSYPRYIQYWEQQQRDKYLKTKSQTSLANETGQYFKLISEQQAVAKKKSYTDTIVGNIVADYLELTIAKEGNYYDSKEAKIKPNSSYGEVLFVDLQPAVQVSSKNNVLLTQVQGVILLAKSLSLVVIMRFRLAVRLRVNAPMSSRTDIKFLKLMQFKG